MDVIQQCEKDKKIIYSFVLCQKTAKQFIKAVKKNSQNESDILAGLIKKWLETSR